MKKILPWLKANWILVVMAVLVLVAVPCGYIFSDSWLDQMKTEREKLAADKIAALNKAKVSYSVASPVPGVSSITANQEANAKLTSFFADQKGKFEGEAKKVVELAVDFNSGAGEKLRYRVLLDNMFPFPKSADRDRQAVAFTKELAGANGRPSAYERLLAGINAGMPPARAKLGQDLAERATRERESIKGTNPTRALTPEETNGIIEKLMAQRLGAYQQAAAKYSVYAGMDSLPVKASSVLRSVPAEPPSIEQCFAWQADLWMIGEFLSAVKNANTPAGAAAPLSLDKATVKRINKITLVPMFRIRGEEDPMSAAEQQLPGAKAPAAGAAVDGQSAMIAPRFGDSPSGRWGGKENKLYEVRYGKLDVIVASSRLPELINAISRTNFMTVVDVDLSEVDVWRDLSEGFYYGDDHVIEASIEIELVWLKGWMTPLVPQGLRDQLGLPLLDGAPPPPPEDSKGGPPGPGGPGGPGGKQPRRDR